MKPRFLFWAFTSRGSLSNGLVNVVRHLMRSTKVDNLQPANFYAIATWINAGYSGWNYFSESCRGGADYLFDVSRVLELFKTLDARSYSVYTFVLYRFCSRNILFLKVKNAFPTLFVFNVAEEWSFLIHFNLLLYFNAHAIEIHSINYTEIIDYFTSLGVWNIQVLFLFFDLHFLGPRIRPFIIRFNQLLYILGLFWRHLLIRGSLVESEGAIHGSWPTLKRLIGSFRRARSTVPVLFNSGRLLIIVDDLIRFTLYFWSLLLMSRPDLLFHLVILLCLIKLRWRSSQRNLWWHASLVWRLLLFLLHNYKFIIIF